MAAGERPAYFRRMKLKTIFMFVGGLSLAVPAPEAFPQALAWPKAIEDNSFLIEEAYNQEDGVVQHISTLMRFGAPLAVSEYSFTQEWPLGSEAHQLSLTLPYSWTAQGGASGLGDTLLNYRYQLSGRQDWAAVAPRLSLVLPTSGRESRKPGIQVNLPASKRLSSWLVVHANAGATVLPATHTRAFNVGASAIGLVTPQINLLLEVASAFTGEPGPSGRRAYVRETVLSPGVRGAINFGSLQVVPGLAVPIRYGGGRRSTGLFAYVSLEHPFRRAGTAPLAERRPARPDARDEG
jgi:hypothetical protein